MTGLESADQNHIGALECDESAFGRFEANDRLVLHVNTMENFILGRNLNNPAPERICPDPNMKRTANFLI